MKTEFKGTKGFHQVMYSAGVCLGVGVKLDVNYYQYTCNSILPDSDKLYEIEKDEIIANMQLYSAAPDLLEACIRLVNDVPIGSENYEAYNLAKAAIKKALNL